MLNVREAILVKSINPFDARSKSQLTKMHTHKKQLITE